MEINPEDIKYIGYQFAEVRPILFTGAGFSLGAMNILNENVPSAWDLQRKIWNVVFPGAAFDQNSTFQDVFDAAIHQQQAATSEILRSSLTIDESTIPSWYATLFKMPWYKIYTLNIDNLADASQRRFELTRKIHSVSSKKFSPIQLKDHKNFLNVIHLNGNLNDIPRGLTFSSTQYAERLAEGDPVYAELASELLTHPFVFIGTKLDEPPLWQHISIRKSRGSNRELRRRSFLITPTIDMAREARLSNYSIRWLKGTTNEFLQIIEKEAFDDIAKGVGRLQIVESAVQNEIALVEELATNPSGGTGFFFGEEPVWADIQKNRAIERGHDKNLVGIITRAMPGALVCVTGTAGSGVSTSLKRAALSISSDGKRVGWVDEYSSIPPFGIPRSSAGKNLEYLFIDEADLFGADLSQVCVDTFSANRNIIIIIGMRSTRRDRCVNKVILSKARIFDFEIPDLTDEDIDELIQVLADEGRLGRLRGLDRSRQREAFKDQARRQLLVGLIFANSGEKLSEKAKTEFFDLSDDDKRIYGVASIATYFRSPMSRESILLAIGNPENEDLARIEELKKCRLLIDNNGQIRTRHRVIAEIVFEAIRQSGFLKELLEGLILSIATELLSTPSTKGKLRKFLTSIMNHDFIHRSMDPNQGAAFYDSIEKILHDDGHFWLQRGCYEIDRGNILMADNWISQAKALLPADSTVATAYGHLLFQKALMNVRSDAAEGLVEEAVAVLNGVIANHGDRSPHAYTILGSQGLAWAKRAHLTFESKRDFLSLLRSVALKGKEKHPYNPQIKGLYDEIQTEYLNLALSS